MVEIAHLGGLQEVIDSSIGGIGMSDEQNNDLAKIIYKKIPTNCEFCSKSSSKREQKIPSLRTTQN
jgi:hypothetical protein